MDSRGLKYIYIGRALKLQLQFLLILLLFLGPVNITQRTDSQLERMSLSSPPLNNMIPATSSSPNREAVGYHTRQATIHPCIVGRSLNPSPHMPRTLLRCGINPSR